MAAVSFSPRLSLECCPTVPVVDYLFGHCEAPSRSTCATQMVFPGERLRCLFRSRPTADDVLSPRRPDSSGNGGTGVGRCGLFAGTEIWRAHLDVVRTPILLCDRDAPMNSGCKLKVPDSGWPSARDAQLRRNRASERNAAAQCRCNPTNILLCSSSSRVDCTDMDGRRNSSTTAQDVLKTGRKAE